MKPNIAVILGSKSDFPVMEKVFSTLDDFKVPYSIAIASAHRTPKLLSDLVQKVELSQNYKVVIAGAGLSAALPGAIAAQTTKPVIGVPLSSKNLDGIDALLSIVQMPPGIPVASVGIDAAQNAALMAVRIVSLTTADSAIGLGGKIQKYMDKKRDEVIAYNNEIAELSSHTITKNFEGKLKFKCPEF